MLGMSTEGNKKCTQSFGGNIPCKMSTHSLRMNWEDDVSTDTKIMGCKVDRTS